MADAGADTDAQGLPYHLRSRSKPAPRAWRQSSEQIQYESDDDQPTKRKRASAGDTLLEAALAGATLRSDVDELARSASSGGQREKKSKRRRTEASESMPAPQRQPATGIFKQFAKGRSAASFTPGQDVGSSGFDDLYDLTPGLDSISQPAGGR